MVKTCKMCGVDKPFSAFYVREGGKPMGRCRLCYNSARSRGGSPFWTHEEDDIIRANYPKGGWAACNETGRGPRAIRQRAYKLGVAYEPMALRRKDKQKLDEVRWGIPVDDRPEFMRRLDYTLMAFRECEPAANLVASLGVAA